jgi:large subunit ribosomal protein L19e
MQLTNQKRLAAKILGCGENRVWVNPDYIDEIASSVQADDIREFIEEGLIRAKAIKGNISCSSTYTSRTTTQGTSEGTRKENGYRKCS